MAPGGLPWICFGQTQQGEDNGQTQDTRDYISRLTFEFSGGVGGRGWREELQKDLLSQIVAPTSHTRISSGNAWTNFNNYSIKLTDQKQNQKIGWLALALALAFPVVSLLKLYIFNWEMVF